MQKLFSVRFTFPEKFLEKVLSYLDGFFTNLIAKLYLKKFKPPSLKIILILILLLGWTSYFYREIFIGLPSPYDLTRRSQKLTTQILDRNGKLLFKIYQDENRTPISLNSLPPYIKNAFLAIEDNGFYQHSGFSVTSVLRAVYHNLSQSKTEGGSTITQQLVKNALLTNEKTWQRKIKELILAIAVESIYNKDQILEMYLNEVGFGGPGYSNKEAARQYFNADASDLTLPQAAFLAGLKVGVWPEQILTLPFPKTFSFPTESGTQSDAAVRLPHQGSTRPSTKYQTGICLSKNRDQGTPLCHVYPRPSG